MRYRVKMVMKVDAILQAGSPEEVTLNLSNGLAAILQKMGAGEVEQESSIEVEGQVERVAENAVEGESPVN